MKRIHIFFLFLVIMLSSCDNKDSKEKSKELKEDHKLMNYASVKLEPNLSYLSEDQKKMIVHLKDVAKDIDAMYWKQSYGDKNELMKKLPNIMDLKYAIINYGPWDRLDGNKPFNGDFPPRPLGQAFYPSDINTSEFFKLKDDQKYNPLTVIRRKPGGLEVIKNSIFFKSEIDNICSSLDKAASLAKDGAFKEYLIARCEDFRSNKFDTSNDLWLKMDNNDIDFIAGPIDNTEDRFLWTKFSYGSLILIKDKKYTEKVEKYASLIPYLQKSLPIKNIKTSGNKNKSKLIIYDVITASGYCNAGGKLISINLPAKIDNSTKDTKKLIFRNIMSAKFKYILKPIADLSIDKNQRKHIKFESFLLNSIFYEISNNLGIETTRTGISIKDAMKNRYFIMNELKNDVLRMYFLTKLHDMGELKDINLMDNYVTHMADVFRSIRFGITDAQGVANMVRFNYFQDKEAFEYNYKTKTYKVNFLKMKEAIKSLSIKTLEIQASGNYAKANKLILEKGFIRNDLLQDLYRIQKKGIAKDIIFE